MLKSDSFILNKAAIVIALFIQVLAVYLFFRGHNLPGGGFVAGVCSGVSILLLVISKGIDAVEKVMRIDPLNIAIIGLCVCLFSGLIAPAIGGSFLSHFHYKSYDAPVFGDLYLGTPQLFDLGVFLAVVGVIVKIPMTLLEANISDEGKSN